MPAAIGYAQESHTPFELGIIRNHYVGRTFIEPEQRIRQLGVKLKHSANASAVRGNRIVLIDDSVVRGTTSKKLVQMMFEAGAREVHFRVACPPITHPDFYGIDTPRTTELLAANMSVDEMCRFMGATSLSFLSVDGVYRALGYDRRDARNPQFTDHCFTGDYPTTLTDQHGPARSASSRSYRKCASQGRVATPEGTTWALPLKRRAMSQLRVWTCKDAPAPATIAAV